MGKTTEARVELVPLRHEDRGWVRHRRSGLWPSHGLHAEMFPAAELVERKLVVDATGVCRRHQARSHWAELLLL